MKIKQSVVDITKSEKAKKDKKRDELTLKIVSFLYEEKELKPNQKLRTLLSIAESLDWSIGRLLAGINEYSKEPSKEPPQEPDKKK